MEAIVLELEAKGFTVHQTKTLHDGDSQSSFYQLKKNDFVYPKSRGNKQDVGQSTILTCYEKFGIDGVLNVFDATDAE